MPDPNLETLQLHAWVDRLRAGDRRAADELVTAVAARLERLARRMLGGYPAARHLADTGDVAQGALLRLMQSLGEVRPQSTRSFFNLAAVQMRRELIDLARKARARRLGEAADSGAADAVPAAADADLDRWAALHTAVGTLPAVEREVFSLTFYHRWSQAQIAELLHISDRQVRRHLTDACVRLRQATGGDVPEAD